MSGQFEHRVKKAEEVRAIMIKEGGHPRPSYYLALTGSGLLAYTSGLAEGMSNRNGGFPKGCYYAGLEVGAPRDCMMSDFFYLQDFLLPHLRRN